MEALSIHTVGSQNANAPDHIETSLRHLLHHAEYIVYEGQEQIQDEEIILDIKLDGHRYLLIRAAAPENQIGLSPREQEIAQLIMKGFPNKTIALTLGISPCTVATHLQRIFAKVGVNSRVEVVARLLQSGVM